MKINAVISDAIDILFIFSPINGFNYFYLTSIKENIKFNFGVNEEGSGLVVQYQIFVPGKGSKINYYI